ncbi:hypothetical protein, partial [Methanoregula sp.]|uniref:hypothetical protein n=1 Tax=Methanoregula sp. TaxID=2052170 RepID=UPI003C71DB74
MNTKIEPCCPHGNYPAICGENSKTGQIAGRYIFPLAVFCKGCFFGRTLYRLVPDRAPGGHYEPESGLGWQENLALLIHSEISEVL